MTRWLALFLLIAILNPADAWAKKKEKPKKIFYSFAENLSQAAALRSSDKDTHPGEWNVDRFQFPTLEGPADIALGEGPATEAGPTQIVWFPAAPELDSNLVFSEVRIGPKLQLQYGLIADWEAEGGKVLPVFFEIWMGEKKLFETQVATKGWKEKTIDLTLPYLLQRRYRFTFRTRTLDKEWRYLVFRGTLE